MKYIVKTLDIMDYLSNKLNIMYERENKYASIIAKLVELKSYIVLGDEVKERIYDYLEEIDAVSYEYATQVFKELFEENKTVLSIVKK